jgi:hypothetical protein
MNAQDWKRPTQPGQTLGIGYDMRNNELFYTINGKLTEVVFTDARPNCTYTAYALCTLTSALVDPNLFRGMCVFASRQIVWVFC